MIRRNQLLVKQITGTTDATPGTRSAHAHGLPAPTPTTSQIDIMVIAPDNDTDNAAAVNVVKVDATSVYVKSNKASVSIVINVWRNTDDVGRP